MLLHVMHVTVSYTKCLLSWSVSISWQRIENTIGLLRNCWNLESKKVQFCAFKMVFSVLFLHLKSVMIGWHLPVQTAVRAGWCECDASRHPSLGSATDNMYHCDVIGHGPPFLVPRSQRTTSERLSYLRKMYFYNHIRQVQHNRYSACLLW